ncbi:MAG: DNA polymerase III subunit delta' [Corynebacterium sp.]|uniref:DNA polymerase III subunit delta' n=1 Tax=Corynebacterium sp. TaxID=1720 RepID=UPI0026DD8534|nr:DNA polymerase III subunit delta' [Corynebacterium sp.]MDO5030951.1 DNA polymerase III subunit delta' [Corynebacterium sp.]
MTERSVFSRMPETGGVRSRLQAAARAAHYRFAQGLPLAGDERPTAPEGEVSGTSLSEVPRDSDMTHAWLFTGPAGSGRSVTATAFAAALLCTRHDNPGCGECEGCRTALAGTHGDIKIVRPEGTIISVATVRDELRPWAYKMPTTADCRVLIIEDADRLNESASNALLKVVEEPPLRTVIIMCAPTTNAEDFSVTLRSRCRHVYVPTPHIDDVVNLLRAERPELTEEQAVWAATVSNGHIGRARGFVSDAGSRDWRGKALDFVEAVFDPARSYLVARNLANEVAGEVKRRMEPLEVAELEKLERSLGVGASGKGAQAALRGSKGVIKELEDNQKRRRRRAESDLIDLSLTDVMGLYRDALVLAFGAEQDAGASGAVDPGGAGASGASVRLINPDRRRTAAELARRLGPEAILESIDAITEVREMLTTAVKPGVLMDQLMANLQIAGQVGRR